MPNRSQAPVQALALKAESISRQEIQDVFTKLASCGHHAAFGISVHKMNEGRPNRDFGIRAEKPSSIR
jgi:hypothetical protein